MSKRNSNRKIYGYCRVSTDEQSKFGHSLEFQEGAIKQYLQNMGYSNNDFEILIDGGKSGSNFNRPAIKEILKQIEANNVEILIFHKLDRVSRSLIDFSNLVKLCTKHNVSIISINENFNFTNANGRGMANVIMAFAQMEREQISERTNNGMIAKLMKGQYCNGGYLPFGILKDKNHKISYDPELKPILKRIFDLYINSNNFIDITSIINKEFDKNFKYKAIVRILNNTIYQGYIEKNGTKFQLIEPIVDPDRMIMNITATKLLKGSRKGRYTKNTYCYKDMVKFKIGDNLIPSYNSTNFKDNSKYIFYYAKDNNGKRIYINEKEIDVAIDKLNLNQEVDMQKKLDELLAMFFKNQISNDDFIIYREKLLSDSKKELSLSNVDYIIIHPNKYIEVVLNK